MAFSQTDSSRASDTLNNYKYYDTTYWGAYIITDSVIWLDLRKDTIPALCRERGHIVSSTQDFVYYRIREGIGYEVVETYKGKTYKLSSSTLDPLWRSIERETDWGISYTDYCDYFKETYVDTDSTTSIIYGDFNGINVAKCARCGHRVIEISPTIEKVTNYTQKPPIKHTKIISFPFLTEEELGDRDIIIAKEKPIKITR